MKDLFDSIKESLLDDTDDFLDRMDKVVGAAWLEKNATGDYKIKDKKSPLGLTITGKLVIDGFEGETIPVTIWTVKKGDVYIVNCPNLKTINGLFTERPLSLDGGLYIENCPKLMSLEGCPPITNSFSCVGNKSIKSLVGAPEHVFGNCYIMKNGKKFTEEQIKASIEVTNRIDCNEEEVEANITEALTEPHLLKLAEYLKTKKSSFKRLIGGQRIYWDKITSKDVMTFENGFTEDAKKACNMILYSRKTGMIITRDRKGDYRDIFMNKYQIDISPSGWRFGQGGQRTTNEILDNLRYASEIIVIYFVSEMDTWELKNARSNARVGMIENSSEQNRKIARENVERYKKLAAQMRTQKNNDYAELDKAVEEIVMKVLKASQTAHRNPDKYSPYAISRINQMIYGKAEYIRGGNYSGTNGVLYLYDQYTDAYMSIAKGTAYNWDIEYKDKYKKQIMDLIVKIKNALTDLGL